jgi:hypothetical protein
MSGRRVGRDRAAEARGVASDLINPDAHGVMLCIAEGDDQLAGRQKRGRQKHRAAPAIVRRGLNS